MLTKQRRKACEETYFDVEGLIHSCIHKHIEEFGGDYDELLAVANAIYMGVYCDHYGIYDAARAKFGSWLYWKLKRELISWVRKQLRQSLEQLNEEEVGKEAEDPRKWEVSEDADYLIHLALDYPTITAQALQVRTARWGDAMFDAICDFVLERGWNFSRFTKAVSEIQERLSR